FRSVTLEPADIPALVGNEMPPPRILIADDSSLLRSALRGLFTGAGEYEIIEAENGTDAVSQAEEHQPDVVILDFAMPGLDGLGVPRVLQKRLPQIPILMYTMHYTRQLVMDAKNAGVTKLISKSDGGDLVATVRELLAATSVRKPDAAKVGEFVFGVPGGQTGT